MEHPLDNPVWNALVSGNSHLALGSGRVKFFDDAVSPFAAMKDTSRDALLELHKLRHTTRPALLWSVDQLDLPEAWMMVDCIPGFQMVFNGNDIPGSKNERITPLTKEHVPEMLALTKLTQPGPFGTRTIEFGHYEGIFNEGKLAAITGQRFHAFDHVEISAVCTHPDFLGRGYAKQLLVSQLDKIITAGNHAYLHVRQDNDRAIAVYKTLGFDIRMPVYFSVIRKA